ncbi:MAG: hypothetical protein ACI4TK_14970, partial [Agathobacter sp.]
MVTQCQGIITNCRTRGNIYITRESNDNVALDGKWIGFSDIGVDDEYYYEYLKIYGLCKAGIVKNSANFGNLYVGTNSDGNVRKIAGLEFFGTEADCLEDFANYGNVICKGKIEIEDEHSDEDDPNIVVYGLYANKSAKRCVNIQKDNVLTTDSKKYWFIFCGIYVSPNGEISDCHFYAVNNSDATVEIISKGENHNSLSDFTVQPFFNNPNWGVVSVADDSQYSAYNGMPVPASCDGHIIIIEGDG